MVYFQPEHRKKLVGVCVCNNRVGKVASPTRRATRAPP